MVAAFYLLQERDRQDVERYESQSGHIGLLGRHRKHAHRFHEVVGLETVQYLSEDAEGRRRLDSF